MILTVTYSKNALLPSGHSYFTNIIVFSGSSCWTVFVTLNSNILICSFDLMN